jgi:hypothetical protein
MELRFQPGSRSSNSNYPANPVKRFPPFAVFATLVVFAVFVRNPPVSTIQHFNISTHALLIGQGIVMGR